MLNLNDIQQGVLQLVFRIADDSGLLLLDLKDLRAMLQHPGAHASEFQAAYGNISAASIGAIQRGLIAIEEQGVGVFFVTQNPLDIPDTVLGQLGNRVQHALRAYTPREQKAVKSAADTFRPNPDFDCATVITNLTTGEALVSTLEGKGAPSIVERTLIRPPSGRVGPITDEERQKILANSPVAGLYDQDIDRESAYEILIARARKASDQNAAKEPPVTPADNDNASGRWTLPGFGTRDDNNQPKPAGRTGYQRETIVEAALKSVARTVASQVGRALVRGILGSLKR
jgi:DNA helicase HerA-like ATPase